jgi:hypothetical protein
MGILTIIAAIPIEYVIGAAVGANAGIAILSVWRLYRLSIENDNLRILLEGWRTERVVMSGALRRKVDESAPVTLRIVK